jgi:hypothetical protein
MVTANVTARRLQIEDAEMARDTSAHYPGAQESRAQNSGHGAVE